MDASRTNIFGAGFGLGFTAFLILLIGAKEAWFTGATILAITAGILTIVFLILFLNEQPAPFRSPAPQALTQEVTVAATTPEKQAAFYDYKGDIHDVIDVEGIGPKYAAKLEAAGIKTTARLIFEGGDRVAEVAQVPKKTADKWIAMCQLIKVNGIGKQYAEALVRGGVMTLQELKTGDPEILAGQVTRYLEGLDATVLGQKVTPKRVQGWQTKAATMRRVRTPIPEA